MTTAAPACSHKKTHRVATVGFWSFNSQLTCASVELESVTQTQVELSRVLTGAHCTAASQCAVDEGVVRCIGLVVDLGIARAQAGARLDNE